MNNDNPFNPSIRYFRTRHSFIGLPAEIEILRGKRQLLTGVKRFIRNHKYGI